VDEGHGLMIVPDMGLEIDILTPSLFSIMVFMTLITTSITPPRMDFVGGKKRH
jgi:hypothetical protein